jgi:hypothetical protein
MKVPRSGGSRLANTYHRASHVTSSPSQEPSHVMRTPARLYEALRGSVPRSTSMPESPSGFGRGAR